MNQMALRIVGLLAIWSLATTARGGLFTWSGSQTLPDGNPSGVAYQNNWTFGPGLEVTDVSLTFSISGGWNGDLYAYLTHVPSGDGAGESLVLLNRVGVGNDSGALYIFGYSGDGFDNITLRDDGLSPVGNIHNYGGSTLNSTLTAGSHWNPDGQAVNPLGDPLNFSASGGSDTFSSKFGSINPSGTWTLFFADLSSGGQATLTGWSLNIEAVPEPVNVALGIFGGVVGSAILVRSKPVRRRIQRWRAAAAAWMDAV